MLVRYFGQGLFNDFSKRFFRGAEQRRESDPARDRCERVAWLHDTAGIL
jgi:hypothetical protein